MKPVLNKSLIIGLALTASLIAPAAAHQPVLLDKQSRQSRTSPVLVEGSISFAVTASFKKGSQNKYFRFALNEGERLKLEYLILDRKPENQIKKANLPLVTIESPSGKLLTLKPNERTRFFEPYGKQNYLFLSRVNQEGESGIYTVKIRSQVKSSILIAVGSEEIRGDVLPIGPSRGTCPSFIKNEEEVTQSRADQLLGLSERAGELCALVNGWGYRVIQRDGEDFPVTMDYRSNRVNVKVRDGKIFEITVG